MTRWRRVPPASRMIASDCLADVTTLTEMIERRASLLGERPALHTADQTYSYAALWRGAIRTARYFQECGVRPGDRILLVLPNVPEFFLAFYGAMFAGAIPAPLFQASRDQRIAAIASVSGASVVVLPRAARHSRFDRLQDLLGAGGVRLIEPPPASYFGYGDAFLDPGTSPGASRCKPSIAHAAPDDVAFLQFTSGSTGGYKGVQLTHRNLLANVRQMGAVFEWTSEDVWVSWLPLYHDMGLIGCSISPVYYGARLVLLPVALDGKEWLSAISRYRGTFTAAPDTAYRYCVKFVPDAASYDLSSLRIACNAAEPVRASTIAAFEQKFGVPGVMRPCYGLAEATLGVTAWELDRGHIKVDRLGMVSAGRPFPGVEVEIAAGDRLTCSPGDVGEIVVRGPNTTSGYWNDPGASASLHLGSDFIRTGDLGYKDDDGDLFIVGRLKNVIIRAGMNYSPGVIEEAVDSTPEIVRSAAIGVDHGDLDGEQIVIIAEVAGALAQDLASVARHVISNVYEAMGIRPDRVYLVAPRTIPLTPNGKTQYTLLREQYRSGSLWADSSLLFPRS